MEKQNFETLKRRILELAQQTPGGVSYSRLSEIPGFKGELSLAHPTFQKVLYWQGISQEAASAIRELIDSGQLRHAPTDELAYLAQGEPLSLPIFTPQLVHNAAELETPHWMPVMVSITTRNGST